MFEAADYIGKTGTLPEPVSCNIIQINNVSVSREKLLEEWRYYDNPSAVPFERMENVSRRVIYGIDLDEKDNPGVLSHHATYKLLLRDASDNYFYAIELEELPFLHPREMNNTNPLPIPLGGRVIIQRGTAVRDGIVLLRRHQCLYLGVDMNGDLARNLNEGIVKKYVEILEKLRSEESPGRTR